MQAKLNDLQTRLHEKFAGVPFGCGRVDAFAHIFTRVLAQDLGEPDSAKPPYAPKTLAPVSYPFVWDSPQHDLVQWNGAAPNSQLLQLVPLGRNIGEVLGVFGGLQITPGRRSFFPWWRTPRKFKSSAKIPNSMALEPERMNINRMVKAELFTLDKIVTDPTMAMNFRGAHG